MSNFKNSFVLIASMIFTIVALGFSASAGAPVVVPSNTTYEPLSGGIANEVTPNFTLNVGIIDIGTGINTANVIADVSSVSTVGTVLMDLNGSLAGPGLTTYFTKTVKVDKIVRGVFNVTVTAQDNFGVSSIPTNLTVVAFMYPGVTVIGYNSSRNVPSHPSNASMFYNNSPVEIIVTTIDKNHYSSVTANFFEADGSIPLESNNSGVLLSDGNYSYRITHTLGTIPNQDARIVWINITMSTAYGPVTIPKIGALVVVSNINPRELPGSDLGGDTTNWRDIADYSAANLVFEPYIGSNKIATLRFNEAINLTDYTTAMNLKNLGEMLKVSGKSMDLNATADALREFNKAASLTIYNLTAFTVSPAILEDGVLLVPSGGTSGGAVLNLVWDNSTHTLSFNVSHWTEYLWDGEPPTVSSGAVGYPAGQTNVRSGQSITLSATIVDSFSGVKNATVNAVSIGAGTVVLNNVSGNWINTSVPVNALDGTYYLNVTAYDKAGNLNNTAQIRVIVSNSLSTANVSISDFSFLPQTITVAAGTTVIWTNLDSVLHTVTSDTGLFDSGSLSTGQTFSRTFNAAGNYDYHCSFHSMTGRVVVSSPTTSGTDTVGIYRNGAFYLRNSNDAGNANLSFIYGIDGDTPLTGDWNGDGIDTVGIYRNGSYYLRNSNSAGSADMAFIYGVDGDIPLIGDWNGDGIDTVGIYRHGSFYIRNSNSAGSADLSFIYGVDGDTPLVGDWNNDGTDTVGIYRHGSFYLRNSNDAGNANLNFIYGVDGDTPIVGDWNGDGIDTVGIYRNGSYYLRNSNSAGSADLSFIYGVDGDTPLAGDWDGQ